MDLVFIHSSTRQTIHGKLPLDKLQQRGFIGPSICALFYKDSESINYLFTQCEFSSFIWPKLLLAFNVHLDFSFGFFDLCLQAMRWQVQSTNYLPLAGFFCYLYLAYLDDTKLSDVWWCESFTSVKHNYTLDTHSRSKLIGHWPHVQHTRESYMSLVTRCQ